MPDGSPNVTKKRYKFLCTMTPVVMGSIGEIGHYLRLDIVKNEGK